jgi:hypothetical protein
MDATIITALVGVAGSIIAAVVAARLTPRPDSRPAQSPQQPALARDSQHDAVPTGLSLGRSFRLCPAPAWFDAGVTDDRLRTFYVVL